MARHLAHESSSGPSLSKKNQKNKCPHSKSFKEAIAVFVQNPLHPQLHNHKLRNEWEGYRSINITADYRAIYEEVNVDEESLAYFVTIGTHEELYKTKKKKN